MLMFVTSFSTSTKGTVFEHYMEITKDNVDKYRERTLEFGYSFFKSKVLLTAVRLMFSTLSVKKDYLW
jgi:hypothetical protein